MTISPITIDPGGTTCVLLYNFGHKNQNYMYVMRVYIIPLPSFILPPVLSLFVCSYIFLDKKPKISLHFICWPFKFIYIFITFDAITCDKATFLFIPYLTNIIFFFFILLDICVALVKDIMKKSLLLMFNKYS